MTSRRTVTLITIACLSVLSLAMVFQSRFSTVPSVQAQEEQQRCSNSDFQGSFGWAAAGSEPTRTGEIMPVITSGHISADGKGHFSGTNTVSLNGLIAHQTITGTYTVNPDCTGQATVHYVTLDQEVPPEDVQVEFVLVDEAREIRFIRTDPNSTFAGNARKQ